MYMHHFHGVKSKSMVYSNCIRVTDTAKCVITLGLSKPYFSFFLTFAHLYIHGGIDIARLSIYTGLGCRLLSTKYSNSWTSLPQWFELGIDIDTQLLHLPFDSRKLTIISCGRRFYWYTYMFRPSHEGQLLMNGPSPVAQSWLDWSSGANRFDIFALKEKRASWFDLRWRYKEYNLVPGSKIMQDGDGCVEGRRNYELLLHNS